MIQTHCVTDTPLRPERASECLEPASQPYCLLMNIHAPRAEIGVEAPEK